MLNTVCSKQAMLELLRKNRPAAVFSLPEEDFVVITRVDPDTLAPIDGVATVEKVSSAGKLLDAAYHAAIFSDLTTWGSLPVRYGPYECMWVLAEESFAPLAPAGRIH
jgi:hypothetical protein